MKFVRFKKKKQVSFPVVVTTDKHNSIAIARKLSQWIIKVDFMNSIGTTKDREHVRTRQDSLAGRRRSG